MQELIIDVHSHILPGVDDGARDSQTSMEMLQTAWKDGIRQIILTPHNKPMRHNVSALTMQKMMEDLRQKAKRQGMEFVFYPGNEVYYTSAVIEELEAGRALTMAGSAYVLVEFGPMDDFDYIRNGVYQILSAGYRPIIAHVERYQCMAEDPSHVAELKEMGCYIQVNAGSIMGQYGLTAKRITRRLLKEKLVHFAASDAHDNGKRAPKLFACKKYIEKKFGEAYMRQIFEENPGKLLENEYI